MKEWTSKVRDTIAFYEEECNAGRAQGQPAKGALNFIIKTFKENDYEFCSHNHAILGSKRYSKCKIEGIDFMLSCKEYKKLKEKTE